MSDSEEDEPKAKKVKNELPVCPYGEKCYRKNPMHFEEYSHKKGSKGKKSKGKRKTVDQDAPKLPDCPFGANCFRKNLLHFAEYAHPCKGGALALADADSDTDVCNSDEEQLTKEEAARKEKVIKRGPSLVKHFSDMSEDERKDLVKQALAVKKELEDELEKTKQEAEKKEAEISKMQDEMRLGLLLMDGEREALEGTEIKKYNLIAERDFQQGSAAQMHFRLAESQFYRLMQGGAYNSYQGTSVTTVEYIVNPKLMLRFKKAQETLRKTRGEEYCNAVLAFHGTKVDNIKSITEGGFNMPGSQGYVHKSGNTGAYGYGVYFSEYPSYSMGYIQGAQQILLSKVLQGKVYKCKSVELGAKLHDGYDSHTSPCGKELVIFDSAHILPCYIVHYASNAGEFKYKKNPDLKRKAVDDEELMRLYWKASKVKVKTAKQIFADERIELLGKLCDTHARLYELLKKFGATKPKTNKATAFTGYTTTAAYTAYDPATGAYTATFTTLVTTNEDYDSNVAVANPAVTCANSYRLPIVREEWIYDCIIKQTKLDTEAYLLND